MGRETLRWIAARVLPAAIIPGQSGAGPRERVRWGNLRRLRPFSTRFGVERGKLICRHYIEVFLAKHAHDIQGHVLEVADNDYTRKFGAHRVEKSDVLHAVPGNPRATIVADLTDGRNLPSDTFDCIILTQTLQMILELRDALRTLQRILRPGGVLLASLPGISQISRYDSQRWGDHWRFTTDSTRKLFGEFWPPDALEIETYGNVLVASAYLLGLACEDLRTHELEFNDPDFQLLITVRAQKPATP